MLEWRRDQDVYVVDDDNANTLANYLYEDKPEAESKIQEELSLPMQPTRTTPTKENYSNKPPYTRSVRTVV